MNPFQEEDIAMAAKQPKHAKLVEYLGRAYEKEREIESALAAQIVMATRPAYQRRLERHLEDTKVRTRKLQKRLGELGAPNGGGPARGATREAKAAAKTVTDRAATLAKAPAGAMGADPEAGKLLENARAQLAGAGEQVANYRIVRSLARAAGDKPTRRLARDFRREHEDLGDYVAKAIPKLSKAVAKQEAEAPSRAGAGRRRSSASSKRSGGSSGRGRSRAGSARGRSSAAAGRSRSSSARGKSGSAASGRSRSSSGRGKAAASSGRGKRTAASGRSQSSSRPKASSSSGRSRSGSSSGAKSTRSRARGGSRKTATKSGSGTRTAATKARST